jgi:6-pyruvoyltetrahydropterin/6-carboxytetrahydropterin synthase
MTTVVRRFQFCAGHRLHGHEGKCAHVHGHNYVACFHVTGDDLDELGRLIDFGALKERLGSWLDEHWDHGFICQREDEELRRALEAIPGQKLFVMDENPTAENLARYLLHVVGPEQLEGTGVRVVRVVLWETENCCAEASL